MSVSPRFRQMANIVLGLGLIHAHPPQPVSWNENFMNVGAKVRQVLENRGEPCGMDVDTWLYAFHLQSARVVRSAPMQAMPRSRVFSA